MRLMLSYFQQICLAPCLLSAMGNILYSLGQRILVDWGRWYFHWLLAKQRHHLHCVGGGITRISIKWCDAYHFIRGGRHNNTQMALKAHHRHNKSRGSTSVGYRSNGGIGFITLETVLFEILILYQIMCILWVETHTTIKWLGEHHFISINHSTCLTCTSDALEWLANVMGKWFGIFNNNNWANILQNRIKEYIPANT